MKKPEREFSSLNCLFKHDGIASEVSIKLLKAVFESAYLLGRKDTIDGLYIDPDLAYEQFKQRQQEQANVLTAYSSGGEGGVH